MAHTDVLRYADVRSRGIWLPCASAASNPLAHIRAMTVIASHRLARMRGPDSGRGYTELSISC
jgi:hypothetical protein